MKTGPNEDKTLHRLAGSLRERQSEIAALTVVAGFDGFVDEMISVVGERSGLGEWTAVPSIAEFGRLVGASAGRSSLREIVVRSMDPGGCAVNLGDGLIALGAQLDYFGTIGEPQHPAFTSFARACRSCRSLGREPGRTLALEFSDGKYMLSAVSQLAEFAPDRLAGFLADGAFQRACRAARLVAITNWTLYPHMTACWRLLQREVLAKLAGRRWLFLDLVDPSSRSAADIADMLAAAGEFQRSCDTVLGINVSEATALSRILGLGAFAHDGDGLRRRAADLRARLGLSQVVIHHARINAVADAAGAIAAAAGPYCAAPKKTTGAGDRFNAGYCLGLMLGLDSESRLALASATSGFFVRHARSGTLAEIADFISGWATGTIA